MSYEMEQQSQPNKDKKKMRGRPIENYSVFLKNLYKGADKRQISSLNVFRHENSKKSVDEVKDYIESFKKKIKHLEYILYERKKEEYAKLQPPTIE